MARTIGGPDSSLYRAVIIATYTDEVAMMTDQRTYGRKNKSLTREGMTLVWYEGPYDSPGKVESRRTIWTRIYEKKPAARMECELQSCSPQWAPLSEASKSPRRAARRR
ncbi:hypothetical protein ACH41H_24105 [Streptomyces sp. NPDC020800]|uniref:hypothetical protein n=1 Tax=Streptomyces sp. NPDC020800 TaxID=3365092 RepID=UPI00379C4769